MYSIAIRSLAIEMAAALIYHLTRVHTLILAGYRRKAPANASEMFAMSGRLPGADPLS